MKTAVPGTRVGCDAFTSVRNRSNGNVLAASLVRRIRRPVCHVDIKVKIAAPTTRGNQPPCGILMRLDERKASSMMKKPLQRNAVSHGLQPHSRWAAKKKSVEVTTIASVTATPYAAARSLD